MKIKCKQNSFIDNIMAMKKHFPSITLLSLVTKFKFAHDILQISFNANINFFPQHLTFNATLLVILAFCITYNLQFLLWRGGGGGLTWIWMLHVHGHVYFSIGKQGKKSLFSKLIIQISDCGWSLKLSANWHNNC